MNPKHIPWEPVDYQFLKETWREGMDINEIASTLERSKRAIEAKIRALGIHRPAGRKRKHDHAKIRELINEGCTDLEAANAIGCYQANVTYVRKLMKAGKP